jgi:hypothetical protein
MTDILRLWYSNKVFTYGGPDWHVRIHIEPKDPFALLTKGIADAARTILAVRLEIGRLGNVDA